MNVVQVPSVRDHQLEVVVIINRGADVGVVLDEFAKCHLAVTVLRMLEPVMDLKSVQKFSQHFFLCFDSLFHIRMVFRAVAVLNVRLCELSRTINVNLLEGLLDEALSDGVHLTGHVSHQLVVGDLAVVISVEQVKQLSALFRRDLDSEVAESLPELLDVQRSTAIVVHDLEDALHAKEAPSSS